MIYYAYILYSRKLDKFYYGSTSDLIGRLRRHNSSSKGFTATGKPWIVAYAELFYNISSAKNKENQWKQWKNRKKIIQLIKTFNDSDPPDLVGRVTGSNRS